MSAIFWIISGIILITLYFLYAGVIMKKNKVKMKRKSCFLGVPLFEERGTAISLFCWFSQTFKRVMN